MQTAYPGPAIGSISTAEARQVIEASEEICPELMRHPDGWDSTPYMRAAAATRHYSADQYGLLLGLCRRYVDGWNAALEDHARRREQRERR
jgi:hypothetical protein